MNNSELQLVEWLKKRAECASTERSPVELGIGDDMALLALPESTQKPRILVSSDMLLDGVHFDTTQHELWRIGRKAIACSLSDCAAMAVKPLCVTVSVALPHNMSNEEAHGLFEGMFNIAQEYDVAVVGGDTTRWPDASAKTVAGFLAIDVAITATPHPGIDPVRRSGARVDDVLYVTGPLGGSRLGHHLDFTPRVLEAKALAEQLGLHLHAMLDISDGLSLDLWRMCQASGVGATLVEDSVERMVSDAARSAAITDGDGGPSPLQRALSDGEDFELLVSIDPAAGDFPIPLHPVGKVVDSGLYLQDKDGNDDQLAPKGYVH